MTSEYQAFRKKIIEELTREDPQMRYKDKMLVVTREWKDRRETQSLQPLSPAEMVSLPINQIFRRRLKATTLQPIPETMCLLGKLLQSRDTNLALQQFRPLFKAGGFYEIRFNGMDLWDMLTVHNGGMVMKEILESHLTQRRLKELVSRLFKEGRLGSLLNVLVGVIYESPDTRLSLVTLLVKMIYNGVSPNTEFQCGEYTASLPGEVSPQVRYAGTTLVEREYISKYPVIHGSVRFVGDTVYGFLLQNLCNLKLKNFTLTLLETGLVNLSTIIQPYSLSLDTHMTYLEAALRFSPVLFRNQVSCAIYRHTPKPLLLRCGVFKEVATDILKTNWRGLVFFNTCPRNILHLMLEDGFVEPSEDLFHSKLLMTPHGRRSLQTSLETFRETPTVKTLLKPDRERVVGLLRGAGFRDMSRYHNDSYFSNSDEVNVESPDVFVSEDGYVFCRDELEYLLRARTNPFNRREFSENEIERMKTMEEVFATYWYLFDMGGRKYRWLTSPADDISETELVKLIDGMFEKNDLFSYGVRISNAVEALKNNALTLMGYTGLMMGVGTILSMTSPDITIEQCISFARGKEDPYDIEEINTYYGIIFNHLHEATNLRKSFLQWVFLVLETTEKFSSSHVMTSRLLSLTLFIQMTMNIR
jgi:hypothetical protein